MQTQKITASEMNRALRNAEIVTTHVHHVVDDENTDGSVSTLCDYYLTPEQYDQRRVFHETHVSVTHICHHCATALRDQLEISSSNGVI